MRNTDPLGAMWRKSSFSGAPDQNCVEVAHIATGVVAVRDSKNPAGPVLQFTPAEWTAFLRGVRASEFELIPVPPGLEQHPAGAAGTASFAGATAGHGGRRAPRPPGPAERNRPLASLPTRVGDDKLADDKLAVEMGAPSRAGHARSGR